MARIEQTELFRFENFDTNIHGKTVGHNRTVSHARTARGMTIIGALHGHAIFELTLERDREAPQNDRYRLRLDHCGYPTRTTRAAMADFLRAAGIRGAVSMAGGELNAWLSFKDGSWHKLRSGGSIIVCTLTPKDWAEFSDLKELA